MLKKRRVIGRELGDEAEECISRLTVKLGTNASAVVRMAVLKLAEAEGVRNYGKNQTEEKKSGDNG